MNTIELYQSPNYEKNEDLNKPGHTERCVCCNRPMKPEQIKFMVHMTTHWTAIDTDDLDMLSYYGYESQGFFPIGTECKNKMPNEFIFKM